MMQRREFLRRILKQTSMLGGSVLGLGVLAACERNQGNSNAAPSQEGLLEGKSFEIAKSPEEWRAILTPAEYEILREHGTERAYTSDLLDERREGTYVCAGCELPLYSSDTKYDSRTGWPSFWEALPDAVGTSIDTSFFMRRTEVHCRRCGGHLGHVFNDGPPPTGKRHCINGVALDFVAS